jgi:integrase
VVAGKRRDIGLGSFPTVPLTEARDKAREYRERIWRGEDPVAERQAAKAALRAAEAASITFNEAAAEYIKVKSAEFRNEKHKRQWSATIATYAGPVIGRLPVREIELAHIVRVLEPHWHDKTETMKRLRGRIEKVLSWATVRGYRDGDNPARWRGNLDAVLPAPGKVKKAGNFAALPWQDVPTFMPALRQRDGMAARAVEFAILTAARSGEVRGATWAEIDLDAATWIIPAGRMKSGREHRVPLSGPAVTLLRALPRMVGSEYVFPAPRGGALSDMSLSAVLRRMEVPATVHGFRSAFRDWCAERTNYTREVAEQALAHAIGDKVEAAYRRGDLFERRRRLMSEWSDYCDGKASAGEVVELAGVRP